MTNLYFLRKWRNIIEHSKYRFHIFNIIIVLLVSEHSHTCVNVIISAINPSFYVPIIFRWPSVPLFNFVWSVLCWPRFLNLNTQSVFNVACTMVHHIISVCVVACSTVHHIISLCCGMYYGPSHYQSVLWHVVRSITLYQSVLWHVVRSITLYQSVLWHVVRSITLSVCVVACTTVHHIISLCCGMY